MIVCFRVLYSLFYIVIFYIFMSVCICIKEGHMEDECFAKCETLYKWSLITIIIIKR